MFESSKIHSADVLKFSTKTLKTMRDFCDFSDLRLRFWKNYGFQGLGIRFGSGSKARMSPIARTAHRRQRLMIGMMDAFVADQFSYRCVGLTESKVKELTYCKMLNCIDNFRSDHNLSSQLKI
uniref:Uncharacterized protein n=1 Tax=Romanomermis culicivorax TaxID=13658 RepID=A0A915JPV1_ROMCU